MRSLRVLTAKGDASLQDMDISDLSQGEVLISSHFSSLNYKDSLAVTNKGKILKQIPLNPGIDVAGTVVEDSSKTFSPGTKVLVTGCGLGEEVDGGLGDHVRVNASIVIPLSGSMTPERAMFFGTAGFTAALAARRLLENHQTPDKGPLLVTGATGGVGSFSVALLAHLGFEVWAMTGKKDSQESYLKSLGASKVVTKEELSLGTRPLENSKFGGAIDNLGGKTLEQILPHIGLWGNVASIGLAEGSEFSSTVMPFILRGVSLLGVSSNNCPLPMRKQIWKDLAQDWNAVGFNNIHKTTISLDQVVETAHQMLDRKTTGRILVKHGSNS